MKKFITATALMVMAQFANASTGPALIESIPQADFSSLEAQIEATAQKDAGFNLKDFKVNWSDVKNCIEVRNEMDDGKLMGTCVVGFGAFQVQGEAVVVVKYDGYSTSVLYTNVE